MYYGLASGCEVLHMSRVYIASLEGLRSPQGGSLVFRGCMSDPNLAHLRVGKSRPHGGSSARPPLVMVAYPLSTNLVTFAPIRTAW